MDDAITRGRGLVAGARRVVVVSGAGLSAASGVPTFRGPDGLWNSYRPEELATPQAFARDPRLVWEWYGWRRGLVAACAPNEGHRALARLALQGDRDVRLISQNVDHLHEEAAREAAGAGDPSPALPLKLHGALMVDRCTKCRARTPGVVDVDASSPEALPHCARCGGLLRPDVVWFGEGLDPHVLEAAFQAARRADLCVAVGTSGVVHPAASVPLATVEAGGSFIEVNPQATPLTRYADVVIAGDASATLPALMDGLEAPG